MSYHSRCCSAAGDTHPVDSLLNLARGSDVYIEQCMGPIKDFAALPNNSQYLLNVSRQLALILFKLDAQLPINSSGTQCASPGRVRLLLYDALQVPLCMMLLLTFASIPTWSLHPACQYKLMQTCHPVMLALPGNMQKLLSCDALTSCD